MPYLFDTDAVSEVLRPRPLPKYLDWLRNVPRDEQFTSARPFTLHAEAR